MTDAPPAPAALPAHAAPAGTDRLPVWTWPARFIGRLHRPLRASIRPDVAFIGGLPIPSPHLLLPAIVIAIPLVFTLLRITVTDVYTESLIFMALAAAIGFVAPALGVVFVFAHAAFDLIRSIGGTYAYSPFDYLLVVAGRAVSFYLLWLLVVEFPLIARSVPWAVMESGRPAEATTRRAVAAASAAAAAALMTFVWTQAAPWLVRPVFTWTFAGAPTDPAIIPVQVWGGAIVGVAAATAGVMAWLRIGTAEAEHAGEVKFDDLEDYDLGELEAEPGEGIAFVSRLATHLFAVFVLGGLITGIIDLVLFGAAALAAQPLAMRVLAAPALRRALVAIPWIVRFAAGFAITFVIGVLVTNAVYQPVLGSEFFPLVVTTTVGLFLFHVLLGAEEAEDRAERAGATRSGAVAAVLAGLALGLAAQLAMPSPALASNCSGLSDCAGALASAGGAAAAAAAAAAGIAAADRANRRRAKRRRRRRGGVEKDTTLTAEMGGQHFVDSAEISPNGDMGEAKTVDRRDPPESPADGS